MSGTPAGQNLSPADVDRFVQKELTPQRGAPADGPGNKDGTIPPAWEGGLTQPPARLEARKWVYDGVRPQCFKDEKPWGESTSPKPGRSVQGQASSPGLKWAMDQE